MIDKNKIIKQYINHPLVKKKPLKSNYERIWNLIEPLDLDDKTNTEIMKTVVNQYVGDRLRIANNVNGKAPYIKQKDRQQLTLLKDIENDLSGSFAFPIGDLIILDVDSVKYNEKWYKKDDVGYKHAMKVMATLSGTLYEQMSSGSIHLFYINDVNYYISNSFNQFSSDWKGEFRVGKKNCWETSTGVRFINNIQGVNLKKLSGSQIGLNILKASKNKASEILDNLLSKPKTTVLYQDTSFDSQNYTISEYLTKMIHKKGLGHNGAWAVIFGAINEYYKSYSFDELWNKIEVALIENEEDQFWLNTKADNWFKVKEQEAQELYEKLEQ